MMSPPGVKSDQEGNNRATEPIDVKEKGGRGDDDCDQLNEQEHIDGKRHLGWVTVMSCKYRVVRDT